MRINRTLLRAVLFCVFSSAALWAQSGTNSGVIAGSVTDASGAVLVGVNVEASSPALIERVRTTTTDSQGLYRIVNLPPGAYTVTFSGSGFAAFRQENIQITTGFTATINASLRVGATNETVTVSAEAPTLDTQDSVVQEILSNRVVQELPLGKSAATYTALVPGAVGTAATNQDVGGVKGENAQGFRIHGSASGDYHQLRDGMFYGTLVAAGNFMSSSNPTAVEEVQIVTSGYTAEDWTGGGHVNIIPKSGGNDLHGSFTADYSNQSLQSNNVSSAVAARGVNPTSPPVLRSLYEVAGGLGGAIKKDKLWFFADARHWVSSSTQAGNYFDANEALAFPNNLYYAQDRKRPAYDSNFYTDAGLRFTYQASKRNKFTANFIQEKNCNCFFNIGAGTLAPEATGDDYYMPNWRAQATWTLPVNNRLLLWAGYTAVVGRVDRRTTGSLPGSISVQDASSNNYVYGVAGTGVLFTQSYGNNDFLDMNENFSATYVKGAHSLKFGFTELQGRGARRALFNNNGISYNFLCQAFTTSGAVNPNNGLPTGSYRIGTTTYSAPQIAGSTVNSLACPAGQALLPNKITQFLNPFNYYIKLQSHAIFAQDQWAISRRLTLNLGVRFDWFASGDQAQTVPAQTQYNIPARQFPEQNGVTDWKDLDPRIGVAYDPFGNGKTALKASISRSVLFEPLGGYTTLTNPGNALVTNNTSRIWKDTNGDFLPNCDLTNAAANGECGVVANASFYPGSGVVPSSTIYSDDVTKGWFNRAYNWQLTASLQREIKPGLTVSFGYYRTWYGNLAVVRNALSTSVNGLAAGTPVPASAYDQYCITVPGAGAPQPLPNSGQQLCNLYDIQPAYFGKLQNMVQKASRYGDERDIYTGIDTTVNARLRGLLIVGGMTAGHEVTDYCVQVNSPQDLHFFSNSAALEFNNNNFNAVGSAIPCYIDPPWYQNLQLKLQAVYTIPWRKIRVSISEQNLPSIPTQATYAFTSSAVSFVPNSNGHTALSGGVTNRVELVTPQTLFQEGRNNQLDLRIGKEFRFWGERSVEPTADFFNLFNASSVLAKATTYNALAPGAPGAWNNVTTLLGARIIKFGVHVNF